MINLLKRISLNEPVLIACWPGMGEVAFRAGLFLKDALGLKSFAKIEASGMFQHSGIVVQKGLVHLPRLEEGTFYFLKQPRGQDLVLFLAPSQPAVEKSYQFSELVLKFAFSLKVSKIFTLAALPQAIEHTRKPLVWISATDKEILAEFSPYQLNVLEEGQISGMNGLILGAAKSKGIRGACLLAEVPLYTLQVENPKASLAVLEVLNKHLKLKINFKPLQERADFLDKEIDKLIGFLKAEVQFPEESPLGDEDIQKIRKDLESFTRVPQSAREKIEDLFRKSYQDIGYVNDLKKLLDEWGAYKDYEDKFLDLFRKKRREAEHG